MATYTTLLVTDVTSEQWEDAVQTPDTARYSLTEPRKVILKWRSKEPPASFASVTTYTHQEIKDIVRTLDWREAEVDLDA